MKRYCFIFAIVLYVIWLTGCGRQENTITESGALDSVISAIPLPEEELEGLENTHSGSSVSASEPEVFNYEYSQMPDMEVPYMPELGYHDSLRMHNNTATAYACWKDFLIIGEVIYRRENGIYERTGEVLQDWLQINDDVDSYLLKQCENLLIAQDAVNNKIVIYDMDTSKRISEYLFEGSALWWVYEGGIYYVGRSGGIFRMNPLSGESEMVHATDGPGNMMIRDNGDISLTRRNEADPNIIECWMLSHDEQGGLSEKKVWETDDKYMWELEFNARGLFLYRDYYDEEGDRRCSFACLGVDGSIEEIIVEKWALLSGLIIVDEGYFLWDSQRLSEKEKVEVLGDFDRLKENAAIVDSISYYDFRGNKLKTWRLIEDGMLEAGYRLVHIVYGNGEIFAFYVNEGIGDLYISKVQPWEGGAVVQE